MADPKGPLGLNLLHSPSEPLIDFIFVHGLGGGSKKTWSKAPALGYYWPRDWLPKDPAFKHVRVLSFGYDSDYGKRKDNCLNIHHFGKSLLGELSTSPYLGDAATPIIMIGHSMGGLVIKKTYLLAKQDPAHEKLVSRFSAIFFLATPHRGSDSAKILDGILKAAYSPRAYVAELRRGSGALQSINDEFRTCSDNLELWSFYETQKLSLGVFSSLIVDPGSATLGLREEKQIPMNADHRSICKFETHSDPNYLILRNSLASTVNNILKGVLKSKEQIRRSQMRDLRQYLGVTEDQDDDLITLEDARMSGTCEWFSNRENFQHWSHFGRDAPAVLWINGNPATGKSVLAGYTIGRLRETNADCSYFFFKHGDKSKSRLSACLRSLALQMAGKNFRIRERLSEMRKEDTKLDNENERSLWRKLFLSGIFQVQFPPQYWVIDGVDECINFDAFFEPILSKLDESIPLRIFISSRHTIELERQFHSLGPRRFRSEKMSTADTLSDIKLLVGSRAESLAVEDDIQRAALIDKILEKSEGSFLWTILVLNELSNSYSEEEIKQVLEEVPRDMVPLYQRTLDLMAQAKRGKKITKAILTWVTCATRPLTIKELSGALKIDVNDTFHKLEEMIMASCGQLVTVDRFGKVHMVHETAREFLLSKDLESEFAIDRSGGHTRIAKVCLAYLVGDEMKAPRASRRGSRRGPGVTIVDKRSEFSKYACASFSYHLGKADPLSDEVLVLIDKFLKANILSWIEVIGQEQNLTPLIRTARSLKSYLRACATERSPLGRELHTIRGWTTDLVRLATKFSDALITSPSAIYSLILPFCPTESTIYSTISPGWRLSVVGLSNTHWDDRLCCLGFQHGQPSTICHGEDYFAVGLSTGIVTIYLAASCQEHKTVNHGEPVRLLLFKKRANLLVSCGMKMIKVWDIPTGEISYSFIAPWRPISLAFEGHLLMVASYRNYIASWDFDKDGAEQPNRPWSHSPEDINKSSRLQPCAISISTGHRMLAVAYSGQPIILWDLEEDTYYGSCGKKLPNGETSTHLVTSLAFNPNPGIDLVAASYLDGELALLNPFQDDELESFRAECNALASSLDGRLLAGSAGNGTIQIFEFETLRLLYRVKSANFFIKQLSFSNDSLRLADIRGTQCNIWEPAMLLRESLGDDICENTQTSIVDATTSDTKVKISAISLHPKGEVVACGKSDGLVSLYDMKSALQLRTLYHHKSSVRILTWCIQQDVIVSVDRSNGIFAWTLMRSPTEGWVTNKALFQSRLDCGKSIIQVLAAEAADKLILSTRDSDHLWRNDGRQEDTRSYSDRLRIRKWVHHPKFQHLVICVEDGAAHVYTWSDWSEIASISLTVNMRRLEWKSVTQYTSGPKRRILLELSELNGSASTRGVYLLDAASFDTENISNEGTVTAKAKEAKEANSVPTGETPTARPVAVPLHVSQLAALAPCVSHIIDLQKGGRLIFLDTHSWVCSAELEGMGADGSISYSRHFFIPYDWFSGTRDIICAATSRDVLVARNDDVVIIKDGLEYAEEVRIDIGKAEQDRIGSLG